MPNPLNTILVPGTNVNMLAFRNWLNELHISHGINTKLQGAEGDGIADDSDVISDVRASIPEPSNAARPPVFFSAGDFRLPGVGALGRGEHWVGVAPASSYGGGRTATNLLLGGTPLDTGGQPFVTLQNLTLDGGGTTPYGFKGGFVSELIGSQITGCTLAGLYLPTASYHPQTSVYSRSVFNGNSGDGVLADAGLSGTQCFNDCLIRDNGGYGINGQFLTGKFVNVVFESNTLSGVNLTDNCDDLLLVAPYFEQNDFANGANGYQMRVNATGKGVITVLNGRFGSTGLTKVAKIDNGRVKFSGGTQVGVPGHVQFAVADTAEVWVDDAFYGYALPANVKVKPRVNISPITPVVMGGSGQSIDISEYSTVFGSGDFTFSAVVECDTSGATMRQIVVGSPNSFQLALSGSASATQNISFGKYGASFVATVAGDIPVNVPTALTYVRSGTTGKLYQNGILIWTGTDDNNYSGAQTYIGELSGLNGKLYACGWHTAALTSQQVFDVWRCGGDINAAGIDVTANMIVSERVPGRVWFQGYAIDTWCSMSGGAKWASLSGAALAPYTVSTLPTGFLGARAMVVDALAPAFLSAVVGGGAVRCPVVHNGIEWVAG